MITGASSDTDKTSNDVLYIDNIQLKHAMWDNILFYHIGSLDLMSIKKLLINRSDQ